MTYKMANSVYDKTGRVYLTNDLGYDATNLSTIKILCMPLNILLCTFLSDFIKKYPFQNLFNLSCIYVFMTSYYIFGLLGTMPLDGEAQARN